MKVVSAKQMAYLESQAYRDGSSESDFMDEAGSGVALVVHDMAESTGLDRQVVLLCGKGNNAGDAYVAGSQLLLLEYEVIAYQMYPINDCTPLCQQHHFEFIDQGGRVIDVTFPEEVTLPSSAIIIDGIFGTGFHGAIEEPIATIIRNINQSRLPIVAVDIPSGLNGETGVVEGEAIIATKTAFLGLPKTGFFLRDGWNHVGQLVYVDFGLPQEYIDGAAAELVMLSSDMLKPLLPPLVRNRHKYQAGHVVGLAGSHAMPGAALLSTLSALCGGAGIVHLLYPEGMEIEMSAGAYELLRKPYTGIESADEIVEFMNKANATLVGPGMGRTDEVSQLLRKVIPQLTKPCVIDADALTLLAEKAFALPPQTVLTPHHGEMKRLLHVDSIQLDMPFLEVCQSYAHEKNVTLVLKGGPTFIFHPGEPIMVNPRGDPGMATAGTGDVLTGLIAALLAQGLSPHHAAMLGVYMHGVAGEWAAASLTSYCMTASDLVTYFPDAFQPNNWNE